MQRIICLNETSALKAVFAAWRAARRNERVFFLRLPTVSPRVERIFSRFENWLLSTSGAAALIDQVPHQKPDWENPDQGLRRDTFRKIEPWQDAHFSLENLEDEDRDYGRAVQHETCKYVALYYPALHALGEYAKDKDPSKISVESANKTFAGIFKAYYPDSALVVAPTHYLLSGFLNVVLTGAVVIFGIIWTLRRVCRKRTDMPVRLACDHDQDPRDANVLNELPEMTPLVLVTRTVSTARNSASAFRVPHTRTHQGDGNFLPREILPALATLIGDSFQLARRHIGKSPGLFIAVIRLPLRRIILRALIARLRPAYYWGRDDYQVEHILRRQELHRIGAQSHGISHAVQGICNLVPPWRYISFDRYYMQSPNLVPLVNGRWAKDMEVQAVGGFGFRAETLRNPPKAEKSIGFMIRYDIDSPRIVEIFRAVAKKYSDFDVYLQIKRGHPHDRHVPAVIAAYTDGLANAKYVEWDAYKIMLSSRWVFADASTVLAEAATIGRPTFFMDIMHNHDVCYYREFPAIQVKTAADALAKLAPLEDGDENYPWDQIAGLVPPPGIDIYNEVRAGFGLPHKRTSAPAALTIATEG